MIERTMLAAKTTEAKKDNSVSQQRKTEPPQPRRSPADQIKFLQRTIGNQRVQGLLRSGALQAKLKISTPGDRYEQEADRVAERVVASKPMQEPDEGEAKVQRKSISDAPVEDNFVQNLGTGQPLDTATRSFFEPRFGYDFSGVRVHTDARAAESARAVNAKAYTVGKDVVFGDRLYEPSNGNGRKLLAHELTHTIQQDKVSGNLLPVSNAIIPKVSLSQYAIQRQPTHNTSELVNFIQLEKYLDEHFRFIVDKLDVLYYSDSDETEVIERLKYWATVPNPPQSRPSPGSRHLERLFMRLQKKSKDIGILAEQKSNYYIQLFNRSNRLNELRILRDTYAPLLGNYEGEKEISFGSVLWENIKNGEVEKQIYAYDKGLSKGIYEGAKGLPKGALAAAKFSIKMQYDPLGAAQDIYNVVKDIDKIKAKVMNSADEYWNTAAKDPVKFAEMTGNIVGQVEVAIAGPKVIAEGTGLLASGVARLAPALGKWSRIAVIGANLGMDYSFHPMSGGTSFANVSTTLSATSRAATITEEVSASVSALQKAQKVTQAAEEVLSAAQKTTQAAQSVATTTVATVPTLASTASAVTPGVVGALATPSLAILQVAEQIPGAEQVPQHGVSQSTIASNQTQLLQQAHKFYLGHDGAVGALVVEGHRFMLLKSGEHGGPWGGTQRGGFPRGRGYGFTQGGYSQGNIATHVEGHAAAIMWQGGILRAVLYVDRAMCQICSRDLPSALPPNSILIVISQDEGTTIIRSTHSQ